MDIETLERRLTSENKRVRLIALKLMLRHPDASPAQIARCLCSNDLQNFGVFEVFELYGAKELGWKRLRGADDEELYRFIDQLQSSETARNLNQPFAILWAIGTSRALDMMLKVKR